MKPRLLGDRIGPERRQLFRGWPPLVGKGSGVQRDGSPSSGNSSVAGLEVSKADGVAMKLSWWLMKGEDLGALNWGEHWGCVCKKKALSPPSTLLQHRNIRRAGQGVLWAGAGTRLSVSGRQVKAE